MNLNDEIAKVAYELYEKSGKVDGRDIEHWLEAEKIVKAKVGTIEVIATVTQPDRSKENRQKA